MPTNLLFQLKHAPDLLRMLVAFIEPHDIANIKRTCKALRHSIAADLVVQCRTETQAKYRRVVRVGDSLRMHSRFGRSAYDIYALPVESKRHYYRMASPSLKGYITWMTTDSGIPVEFSTEKHLFSAKTIHTQHVIELNSGQRILVVAQLEFDNEKPFTVNMFFAPCSALPPYGYLE